MKQGEIAIVNLVSERTSDPRGPDVVIQQGNRSIELGVHKRNDVTLPLYHGALEIEICENEAQVYLLNPAMHTLKILYAVGNSDLDWSTCKRWSSTLIKLDARTKGHIWIWGGP